MNNTSQIQQNIGVCFQHDIFFDELTAYQHLVLFCMIKGFPITKQKAEIESKLKAVKLWDVRHHKTKTFSGGMKRRLSFCIALLGDPKMVFLDEVCQFYF